MHTPLDQAGTGAARVVGVRELRTDLAGAIRRAAGGERTIVTSHGQPLAQLGPLDAGTRDLDVLVSGGAIIAPRRRGTWRPPPPVAVWAGVRLDQALRDLRG